MCTVSTSDGTVSLYVHSVYNLHNGFSVIYMVVFLGGGGIPTQSRSFFSSRMFLKNIVPEGGGGDLFEISKKRPFRKGMGHGGGVTIFFRCGPQNLGVSASSRKPWSALRARISSCLARCSNISFQWRKKRVGNLCILMC